MTTQDDIKDKQLIRDQLGDNTTEFPVIFGFTENDIIVEEVVTKFTKTNISGMIWDNVFGGIWDQDYWADTNDRFPFILGHPSFGLLGMSQLGGTFGVVELHSVVSPFNRYNEWLTNNDFVNTTLTTAVVNNTLFRIQFS